MNGNIQSLNIAGYRCLLYLPQEYCANDEDYPVIYINGEDDVQEIMELMESHRPINAFSRVYMSLGKGEEKSRNQLMATVGDCTCKADLILKEQLESEKNIMLEWNEGGHFNEIPKRFEKAMLKLLQIKIT